MSPPPGNSTTSQTLGRLEAQVEGLGELLSEIRVAMGSQVEATARTGEQISQIDQRVGTLFALVSGADGAGGISGRIMRLERVTSTAESALRKIDRAAEDHKKLMIKILALALGGSTIGGAGVAKLIAILAGQ